MFGELNVFISLRQTNKLKPMKKIFALAIVVVALASCKKDYTCECTILGQTASYTYTKTTKDAATDSCNLANTGASLLGGSCSLK